MTEQELEQVIQGYLLDIYKAKYIGKLKVKKLLPFGYQVSLGMNTPECPYIIYAELNSIDRLSSKCRYLAYQEIKHINKLIDDTK